MLPEQLITKEEIERIIQAADNTRDKAFLATLLESGCRIGEVGLMKIKDVCFEEIGARISVTGKTGPRKMKVVRCVPYHQTWINCHPLNENPDSYLWYNPQWKEVKNGKEI
jgi:integrase